MQYNLCASTLAAHDIGYGTSVVGRQLAGAKGELGRSTICARGEPFRRDSQAACAAALHLPPFPRYAFWIKDVADAVDGAKGAEVEPMLTKQLAHFDDVLIE